MLDEFRRRAAERYHKVKKRDEEWILRINLPWVQTMLWLLFAILVVLEFVDVVSTLAALNFPTIFSELNPIAAGLFQLKFLGFLLALTLKYAPLIPIGYGVFLREPQARSAQVRAVKIGTLVVLVTANIIYIAIATNNLSYLARLVA